jgi:phosphoglycerate dehydrogenase-like enzyme
LHAEVACLAATMGDAIVGIIGMGDMGKMYARRISKAGWRYASSV